MTIRHRTRRPSQQAGALLAAFLLLFSAVASAYCSVDEKFAQGSRSAVQAKSIAGTPPSHGDGASDACPGLDDPDKDGPNVCAQLDALQDGPSWLDRDVSSVSKRVILPARRAPVAESVFQRFPRLLI